MSKCVITNITGENSSVHVLYVCPFHLVNNHTCTRILLIMRADVRMCNKSVACKELRAVLLHESFPEKFML